jgi:DNA-binding transcriptional MerR regulator
MGTSLSIGDFSRMTHLSVKALRYYHDIGLLAPAGVDAMTGYRSYDVDQAPVAQVIRRLRDLDMPLDEVKAVLVAPSVATRNARITSHLDRMERQLAETEATVRSLRHLIEEPPQQVAVEFLSRPAASVIALRDVVVTDEFVDWWMAAFTEIRAALDASGAAPAGPAGALYPGTFFELEKAEVTAFIPAPPEVPAPGRLERLVIPPAEMAVAVHEGSFEDQDRTYAALGRVVAERAIGVDGPIREYYRVSVFDTDDETALRTEIGWPVFLTAPPS